MKKLILLLLLALAFNTAQAESDRYDIVSKEGIKTTWDQPSCSTPEGKMRVASLRRVPADQWNGREFLNENSVKGCAIRCRFVPGKHAVVLVEEREVTVKEGLFGKKTTKVIEVPLYLTGCLGGTYYNRIRLVEEAPAHPVRRCEPRPEPQPVFQPQLVYERTGPSFETGATYGEYESCHSMEFGVMPERREVYPACTRRYPRFFTRPPVYRRDVVVIREPRCHTFRRPPAPVGAPGWNAP